MATTDRFRESVHWPAPPGAKAHRPAKGELGVSSPIVNLLPRLVWFASWLQA
jgi:hypothetical protein